MSKNSDSANFLYENPFGRFILKCAMALRYEKLAAAFLKSGLSRFMIKRNIEKYNIDMSDFEGQEYRSYSDFFSRKKERISFDQDPLSLIAPCDSLLSACEITEELVVPMKGSHYSLSDILPDQKLAESFEGGLMLIFRLEASDYHHFCAIDDGLLRESRYIAGKLHSVQPIALRHYPVFKQNRRWYSLIETEHFGNIVQAEIAAMMVGGLSLPKDGSAFKKGEDIGNFELAGSTLLIILSPEIRERLKFKDEISSAIEDGAEFRVKIGEAIGKLV